LAKFWADGFANLSADASVDALAYVWAYARTDTCVASRNHSNTYTSHTDSSYNRAIRSTSAVAHIESVCSTDGVAYSFTNAARYGSTDTSSDTHTTADCNLNVTANVFGDTCADADADTTGGAPDATGADEYA
jgi:hypothetical protein